MIWAFFCDIFSLADIWHQMSVDWTSQIISTSPWEDTNWASTKGAPFRHHIPKAGYVDERFSFSRWWLSTSDRGFQWAHTFVQFDSSPEAWLFAVAVYRTQESTLVITGPLFRRGEGGKRLITSCCPKGKFPTRELHSMSLRELYRSGLRIQMLPYPHSHYWGSMPQIDSIILYLGLYSLQPRDSAERHITTVTHLDPLVSHREALTV